MLANAGVKGQDAGTSFKTFLLALRGPSEDARKAITELSKSTGIDVSPYDKATGALKPLTVVVDSFSRALKGVKDESRDAFLDKVFGADAARVAIALFSEGREGLESYVAAMSEAGTAQRVAEANTKGLAGAWDALMSTVETLADSIFEDLEGPLTQVVRLMTDGVATIADVWASLGPGVKAALGGFLGFAAAIGPVIVAVASAAGAFIGLVGAVGGLQVASAIAVAAGTTLVAALAPVVVATLKIIAVISAVTLAVGAGVALLSAAWANNFLHIRDTTQRVWDAVKAHTLASLQIVREAWDRIYPTLESLTTKTLAAVERAWELVGKKIVGAVLAAWDVVAPIMRKVLETVLEAVNLVLKVIDGDWEGAWQSFARIVVRGVIEFGVQMERLKVVAGAAIVALIAEILSLADRFKAAAVELAVRFIYGFSEAVEAGKAQITVAITNALIDAASGVNPEMIAMGVAARFVAALNKAISDGMPAVGSDSIKGPEIGFDSVRLNPDGSLFKEGENKKGLPGLMGGGGGGKGGGGGESPRLKAAKAELERLQIIFRALQRVEDARLSDEDYFYGEGLRSIEAYAAARKTAQLNITNEALRGARQEVEVARLTKGTAQERANAVNSALDKIAEVEDTHRRKMLEEDRKSSKARQDEQRTLWQNTTTRLEEFASAQGDIYQRLADRGVMTFARAQALIAASQLEMLIREQKRIENELSKLDPNSSQAKDLRGQLSTQTQRIDLFKQTNPHNAGDSSRRDVETEARRADDLRSIWDSIADSERESQADRLRVLEAAGVRRETIWKKQAEFELEMEREASRRRVEELNRLIEQTAKLEGNEHHKADLIRAYNSQIEAEERRSAQRRSNIVEDYYAKQDERLRGYVNKALGFLRSAVDKYREEGWGGFFRSLAEDFRNVLLEMAEDLLKSRLLQLMRSVFKMPAPGSTQGSQQGAQQPGQGFGGFLDLFKQVLHIGGGSQDAEAVTAAGAAATDAIQSGWGDSKREIEQTGDKQAKSLTGVGQSIVSALAAIGSQIAAGAGRGSFWKGLLFAAASGAVSGGLGAAFSGGGGSGGESGGGGGGMNGSGFGLPGAGGTGAPPFAFGGLLSGPGHGTSDNILGVDPRTLSPTAWVSPGEYVIRAASVSKLGKGTLDYLNATGALPEFSFGGMLRNAIRQARETRRQAAFNAANPQGLRRDLNGGGFEFTPPFLLPRRAAGGPVSAAPFADYVPPATSAGSSAAQVANNRNVTVHLTQNFDTKGQPVSAQTARQAARRMKGAVAQELQ
jgi:hypothetical protein